MAQESQAADARQRLLDAGEELFSKNGFEGTSLRAVTQAASVNVASANYYFGSKEGLFWAVVKRKVEPINRERLALLESYRADGLTVQTTVRALLWPMAKIVAQGHGLRLMGRCMTESPEMQQKLYENYFFEIGKRFMEAFCEAMPHLSRTEVHWRFHFAVSLMVGAFIQHERLAYLLPSEYEKADAEGFLQRLSDYMIAGLEAPAKTADRTDNQQ